MAEQGTLPDDADTDGKAIDAGLAKLRAEISAYRGKHGKLYRGSFDGAPVVPRAELLSDCRVLHDRHDIVARLPQGGVFAELGTMFGNFAAKVLELYRPSELHLFDFGFNNLTGANRAALEASGKVRFHVGDSSSKLAEMPDGYFDVVYVDADHSYAGVCKDLQQALKKTKPGGYIVCNDYTNFDPIQMVPYGVYSAVNRFANDNNLQFVFIALSAWGFHDVALRR